MFPVNIFILVASKPAKTSGAGNLLARHYASKLTTDKVKMLHLCRLHVTLNNPKNARLEKLRATMYTKYRFF